METYGPQLSPEGTYLYETLQVKDANIFQAELDSQERLHQVEEPITSGPEPTRALVPNPPHEAHIFSPPLLDGYISGVTGRDNLPTRRPNYDQMPESIAASNEIIQTGMLLNDRTRQTGHEVLAVIKGYYRGASPGDAHDYFIEPKFISQNEKSEVGIPEDEDDGEISYPIGAIHTHPGPKGGAPSLSDLRGLLSQDTQVEFIVSDQEGKAPEANPGIMMYAVLPTDKMQDSARFEWGNRDALVGQELNDMMVSTLQASSELFPLRYSQRIAEAEYSTLVKDRTLQLQEEKFYKFCNERGLAVYKLNLSNNDFIFRKIAAPQVAARPVPASV